MEAVPPDIEPGSIAIVGLAGRFPGARSPAQLWSLLEGGREATQWLTPDELRAAGVPDADIDDPDYVRASLVLPDMEMFDAEFFGFSKRDAAVLDPQHRHFLECAWEALEDAGHMPENFKGAIGVFGGCGMQAYLPYNLLTNPELVKSMGLFLLRHTGNDKDFLCSRVSYLLNLKGPSISVQTACSTSLVAVHMAGQSLLSGECDMALAGGVSIELPHRQGYHYAEGEILSPDGHCRAFDDQAAGTLFGSGAGIVVLRRLEDAIRDRDNIYAVIRGSAVNNDGSQKAGYLAPSVDGQARAAAEALAVAGVAPATVSYIEAHGTGTPVGDPIELAALAQAYGGAARGSCGIGSLKTNIGHLDTAAGVASLIKVALAMRHGLIPASLNFSRPNSRFELAATPFRVVDQARPWPRGGAPRRAAVNSLGVGGTNVHVIVEEPPLQPAVADTGWHVVTLSARTPAALERLKAKWRDFLDTPPLGLTLADAAYTTQVGRRTFEHRCAIVARDLADLRAVLGAKNHPRCFNGKATAAAPGVALMFPGGGAHYPGAGRELLGQPAFRRAVDECFALMPADAPPDLRTRMFEGDPQDAAAASTLERPSYALPALFTLEYALAKLWESWGIVPAAVIGHSAGEYAAACLAGVMSLADALSVVVVRGRLFEEVPLGGMLSVDLAEPELREAMEGLDLDIAAINARDLCIASGALQSISRLEKRLADKGIEGRRLHINVAAHSHLLDGVLGAFRQHVSHIRLSAPSIPFVSNLTGTWADAQALADPEYWVKHLRNPVRFSDGVRTLLELPDTVLVEAGPGQGLCALARQNCQGQPRTILPSTSKAQEPNADLAQMMSAAAGLWTRGAAPKWEVLRGTAQPRRVSVPTYAFELQRHWIEPGVVQHPQARTQEAKPARSALIDRLESRDDWFTTPRWAAIPPAAAAAAPVHWLVFGSRSKLTADVVAQAAREGGSVTVVRRGDAFAKLADGSFTIDARNAAHYGELLAALEQAQALPEQILHLWPLDTIQSAGSRRIAGQTLAFDSLLHLAKAVQERDMDSPIRLTVVTAGCQAVMGEAVPHPERALALGPCRVIPHELPNVRARMIDLAPFDVSSEGAARQIVAESRSDDDIDLVALRDGQRWAQQLVEDAATPASGAAQRVRNGGVYLITGGLGDIALDLVAWLAVTHQARVALVSRRALPAKANWRGLAASGDHSSEVRVIRRLLAFEDEGAQVAVYRADVADRDAMAKVVGDCRAQFGTINGVFHAAGTLEDGLIAAKSADSVERVLNPKACGAQVLHELLPPGDLDVFAVFSSTSVFLGSAGQVDYVAANAFLDALAASRSDGLVIHWGIWGDKGMAARAYGRHGLGHAPEGTHPLLGLQAGSGEGIAFEANYSPRDLWVLQEHSVAGRPVLPGTAYIEIARAAMGVLHPGAGIEICALSFEEAMVFDGASARLVRTEMQPAGEGYEFLVRSRGPLDEHWLEHARARVSVYAGTLPAASPVRSGGEWRKGAIPQAQAVAFGARWNNIARMQLNERSAIAEISLPEQFEDDLAEYTSHPALTDMAATFGLHLVDSAQRRANLFVPLSIERIRLVAPVPRTTISRVQLKGGPQDRFAAFDVSLHTPDGLPVATFEGFSLRGVQPAAMSHQDRNRARREPSLPEAMLARGIKAEDAPALFDRIFRGASRDVVVSSMAIADIRRAMAAAAPKGAMRKAAGSGEPAQAAGEGLNAVERTIADAWRELLGVEEIGRDDDFFALGGHSLAAVRLFAKIRKNFAVDLPLATLFQASTLGGLAAVVAHSAGLETPPVADAPKKAASNVIPLGTRAWSPLVAICRGRADRKPLFCVHGAGGNVLNFKVLSDRLGADQPFYGLQAQGADGRLPALTSVEAMAAQYVEAIRTVDPQGPYRLAGYSGGGMIALEMAQQLVKTGAKIDLLLMIDTLSPAAARRKVSYFKKLWLMRHWSLKFALDWPERRRKSKLMDLNYGLALEKLARGEPLPPELVEHHLFVNFVAAQAHYNPQPYEGPVALFKATESEMLYLQAGRSLGWEEHIRGEIRVTDIAGSHFSMMAEPGVSELIEGMRKELSAADDKPVHPQTRVA
ncbi:MAG: polyketide synthase-like protein [Ramlibacter sp.]|nr:polyketide synthase-like protein [Ramlibacter sp.]